MPKPAVDAVREGRATFDWFAVESASGSHRATFHLFADALRVDGVRETFSPREAQVVADLLGALLPTPKLLDLRAAQAPVQTLPQPKAYPGGAGMSSRQATLEHSARVEAAIGGRAGAASNVGKHWVLHRKVTKDRAVLYGWHVTEADTTLSRGKRHWRGIDLQPAVVTPQAYVIQRAEAAHDHAHHDYSMTLLLLHADCVVDGEPRKTADVLSSPELAGLAVDDGAPVAPRLPSAPAPSAPARTPAAPSPAPGARPLLRRGDAGGAVAELQQLLVTAGFDLGPEGADGHFGAATERAVRSFQASRSLDVDGLVGRGTWAALEGGAPATAPESHADDEPARPSFPPLVGDADRRRVFGAFEFQPAPQPGNPEAIRIVGDWVAKNIVAVEIPQLAKVPGVPWQGRIAGKGPAKGRVLCHAKIAGQLRALWAAWEEAGLLERVLTFDGLWVPRFIRGSRTTLSNHAYGSAFDVNAAWNALGADPARGKGSVRDLVPLALEHGFYWGGHFSRRDGMHFEAAQIDPGEEGVALPRARGRAVKKPARKRARERR